MAFERHAKQYEMAVFIGRFQPFHQGHLVTCQLALEQAHQLIILVGSAMDGPMPKNPWSFKAVSAMIRHALPDSVQARVYIVPVLDSLYDSHAWIKRVTDLVLLHAQSDQGIALVGFEKDHSSAYLNWFQPWSRMHVSMHVLASQNVQLDATMIRECLWQDKLIPKDALPETTATMLKAYQATKAYHDMCAAWQWQCEDEARFPIDYLVILMDGAQVALIKRDRPLGQGQWALPSFTSAVERQAWLNRAGLANVAGHVIERPSMLLNKTYDVLSIQLAETPLAQTWTWFAAHALTDMVIFADHRSLLYQPLSLKY